MHVIKSLPMVHILHRYIYARPRLKSPIYLIKGSRVLEAAVPDLVDDPCGVHVVFDARPRHHGECGATPHAVLELLCYAPLVLGEELAGEAAFAGEGGGADLVGVSGWYLWDCECSEGGGSCLCISCVERT
jgi:hypothetical protein